MNLDSILAFPGRILFSSFFEGYFFVSKPYIHLSIFNFIIFIIETKQHAVKVIYSQKKKL